MYLYFYDSLTNQKKHLAELHRVEARLLDLGINGRIERLSVLKNAKEMVTDGIKQGADTIIAVGNDATFRRLIPIVAAYEVTLGFIPIEESRIAKILGIPMGEHACDTLSRRFVQKVDLGKVKNSYFFASLEFPDRGVKIECDGQYRVIPTHPQSTVSICNLGSIFESKALAASMVSNPCDGRLEAVMREPATSGWRSHFGSSRSEMRSVFSAKKFRVEGIEKDSKVVVDHDQVMKTPLTVEVLPQRLALIVGKYRMI